MSRKWLKRRDAKTQNTEMLIHVTCACVQMNKNFNFGSYKRNMIREVGEGYITY